MNEGGHPTPQANREENNAEDLRGTRSRAPTWSRPEATPWLFLPYESMNWRFFGLSQLEFWVLSVITEGVLLLLR